VLVQDTDSQMRRACLLGGSLQLCSILGWQWIVPKQWTVAIDYLGRSSNKQ
jgi:hypothetical protein